MQPKLANLNLKTAKCKHLFQDLSFLISHLIFVFLHWEHSGYFKTPNIYVSSPLFEKLSFPAAPTLTDYFNKSAEFHHAFHR